MTPHHNRIFALRHARSTGLIRTLLTAAAALAVIAVITSTFTLYVMGIYRTTADAAREQVPHRIATIQFEYFTAAD